MHNDDLDSSEVAATVPGHVPSARRSSNQQNTLVGDPKVNNARSSGPYRFLRPAERDDELGRLGNYRVLKLLGRGGMAFVFLAEDLALHRQIALKVMKPDLERDPTANQRFLHEARLLASIKHDHLVTVYQVGEDGKIVYLAMELLQGETLECRIERSGPPRSPEIVRLAREMATGLGVIHKHGLIHRDIKPSNLWLEEPGRRVKLLDFGLARRVDDDARFTQSGNIVGTPAYMSPEQARGGNMDARSDLFSLGGVLYHLCTGRMPFEAPTTMGMLTALAVDTPRPIHEFNPNVPNRLVALINDLLAKNADDRPASAQIVVERLSNIEANPLSAADSADWDFDEADTVAVAPLPSKVYQRRKQASKRQATQWAIALGLGALLLVGSGIALVAGLSRSSASSSKSAATSAAATPAAVVPKKEVMPPKSVPTAESRKAYLSDLLAFESNLSRSLPMSKGGGPPPIDFDRVIVDGRSVTHGIFMHPPFRPDGGTTSSSYRIARKYDTFRTDVTLNDGPPRSETPITFSVYGDDKLLWKSKPVSTQADRQSCSVSIKDVEKLTIRVDCPGEPHGAHAVWVDPMVSAAK